mmetsp:Transcript_137073/g.249951  ORF Transcript_137073/g.249951 Transcript_137073/m.249951 type:complete len:217 (+) Transcript_137073:475-1125(+)
MLLTSNMNPSSLWKKRDARQRDGARKLWIMPPSSGRWSIRHNNWRRNGLRTRRVCASSPPQRAQVAPPTRQPRVGGLLHPPLLTVAALRSTELAAASHQSSALPEKAPRLRLLRLLRERRPEGQAFSHSSDAASLAAMALMSGQKPMGSMLGMLAVAEAKAAASLRVKLRVPPRCRLLPMRAARLWREGSRQFWQRWLRSLLRWHSSNSGVERRCP